jgi:hypothetical protein
MVVGDSGGGVGDMGEGRAVRYLGDGGGVRQLSDGGRVGDGSGIGHGGGVGDLSDGSGIGHGSGVRDLGDGGGVRQLGDGGSIRQLGDGGSVGDLSRSGGLDRVSLVTHDGVESVLLVGGVLDDAVHAIGLHQGVGAVHSVALTRLPLLLDVTAVLVVYGVLELVVGGRLHLGVRYLGDWHQGDS